MRKTSSATPALVIAYRRMSMSWPAQMNSTPTISPKVASPTATACIKARAAVFHVSLTMNARDPGVGLTLYCA